MTTLSRCSPILFSERPLSGLGWALLILGCPPQGLKLAFADPIWTLQSMQIIYFHWMLTVKACNAWWPGSKMGPPRIGGGKISPLSSNSRLRHWLLAYKFITYVPYLDHFKALHFSGIYFQYRDFQFRGSKLIFNVLYSHFKECLLYIFSALCFRFT